ncbi:MAG: hypothetical protein RR573_03330 [Oscillospiraceae bacterium]
MIKEWQFEDEYKMVTPQLQPYAKLPATKAAEKAWWQDYYKRNPTLLMRLGKCLAKKEIAKMS